MNLFPNKRDKSVSNNGKPQTDEELKEAFDYACLVFRKACAVEHLQRHQFTLHVSDPPTLQAVILTPLASGPRVTLINDTITFDWRDAAFIFLQYNETRELIRKVIERNRCFGVNTLEVMQNYKNQVKRDLAREKSEKPEG